jgi:hypothetical protein
MESFLVIVQDPQSIAKTLTLGDGGSALIQVKYKRQNKISADSPPVWFGI